MILHTSHVTDEAGGNLRLLDRLCDEFESSWLDGRRPSLRNFLIRAPAEIRSEAFEELLAVEVGYRRQLGEQPSAAEYQLQFDEFSAQVEQHFGRDFNGEIVQPTALGQSSWPQIPGLQVERLLGRGGMGIVYLAQQRALKRHVALKMLKSGADAGEEERARFRLEVESAASLHHPNIVQIYEVGEFEGQPFCVMEYVPGESLRDLLRRGPQPADVAAELIAVLANAVDHAHQHGIIHRDLKPANILLEMVGAPASSPPPAVANADTEVDPGSAPTNASNNSKSKRRSHHRDGLVACAENAATPQWLRPKVSDFGLARRLEAADTAHTQTGALLGTPAYMAPEQAAGRSKEVSRATDVYALGAVLYELLTGRPPHQGAELWETLDLIRNQEAVAPRVLQPRVPPDLNTICLKCLAKEPSRRYETASDLAQDLRRVREGQPIHARPVGPLERTSKWVRRNPVVATLSTAVVLIAVTAFATVYSRLVAERQARRDANLAREAEAEQRVVAQNEQAKAQNEQVKAQTEAATALAISQFLRDDLLKQASPRSGPDRNVQLRTILDRAAQRVAGRFSDQPQVEAAIRMTLANTYSDLGLAQESLPHLERAYELRAKVLGQEHRDTLVSMGSLAQVYKTQGRYAEAQALMQQSLEAARRVMGDEHPDTLAMMANTAELYANQGRHQDAERLHNETLAIRRRVLGPDHPSTLISMNNLSQLYAGLARHDEAAELAEQVLEARRRVLGDEHPDTLSSLNALAGKLKFQRRFDEAASLYEQTIETRRRVLGNDHPDTLNSLNNLAGLFLDRGEYQKAEPLLQQVLETRRRLLGDEHPDTLVSMNNLSDCYSSQLRHAEAEPLLQHIVKVQRRLQGDENPRTLIYMNNLALSLNKLGRFAEAEPLHSRVVETHRRLLGDNHPTTLTAINNLALCYKSQARYDQAESLYQEVLATRQRLLGESHVQTLFSMNNLGALFKAQSRYDEAQPLYERALAGRRTKLGDDHPDTLTSINNLALLYEDQKNFADAEPLYLELIDRSKAKWGETHTETLDGMVGLGRLHETTGNWSKAASVYAERLELLRRDPGDRQTSLVSCLTALARVHNKLQQYDQAEPLAKEALAWYRERMPSNWQRGKVCAIFGDSLTGQQKFTEAEPLLLDAWKILDSRQKDIPKTTRDQVLSDCLQSLIALYTAWDKPDRVSTWVALSKTHALKE